MIGRFEIIDFVKRVKFHGMTFSIGDNVGTAGIRFDILHRTTDSISLQPVRIGQSFTMPSEFWDHRELSRWLFRVIQERLTHDAAEMFQVDGMRPYYPMEHIERDHSEAIRTRVTWEIPEPKP